MYYTYCTAAAAALEPLMFVEIDFCAIFYCCDTRFYAAVTFALVQQAVVEFRYVGVAARFPAIAVLTRSRVHYICEEFCFCPIDRFLALYKILSWYIFVLVKSTVIIPFGSFLSHPFSLMTTG